MRVHRRVGLLVLVVALPAAAEAQKAGGTGLVMGYPPSVAVLWHASDRVAFRPELGFAFSSSDLASMLGETTTSQIGGGLSALFYVSRRGPLQTYLSPRIAVTRTMTTLRASPIGERAASGRRVEVGGVFGAQYRPSDRFGLFGETGIERTRANVDAGADADIRGTTWSPRTAAGVVLYF